MSANQDSLSQNGDQSAALQHDMWVVIGRQTVQIAQMEQALQILQERLASVTAPATPPELTSSETSGAESVPSTPPNRRARRSQR